MEKEFYSVSSVIEAVSLKDSNSIYYAGGTEINRLNSGLSDFSMISLKKLNLINIESFDNCLKIDSCTTFQQIIDSQLVPAYLKKACYFMASRTKRNMATIGGNIALRRYDSYLIPTLVVAGAKLIVQNKNSDEVTINLIDYIGKNNEYSDSLIISVLLPCNNIYIKSKRCSNTALSHSFITVSLSLNDGQFCLFSGLKNSGFAKLPTVTSVLNRKKSVSLKDICELVNSTNEIHFYDDIYGSVEYKKYILSVSIYELFKSIKGDK